MKVLFLVLVVCLLALLPLSSNAKKCRALVLEGGGDKGSYQAGAIRGMFERLGQQDASYDVLSGVSIGAINAVGYSLHREGMEEEATNWLVDFWRGMDTSKMYTNWDWWLVEGALWRGGLLNDTIFIDYLNEVLPKDGIFKRLSVGATDTKTGQFVRFTEELGYEDMVFKGARASASIPGVFEPVTFKNMTLVDGGILINLDIGGAIERCLEMVDDEKDIIIDIVMCSGSELEPVDASKFNSLQMFWRYYKINQYQKSMIWITQGLANYPRVNFRYIVVPDSNLDNSWVPIDFSPEHIEKLIEAGKEDAKKAVDAGEGVMFTHIKNFWSRNNVNPTSTQTFGQYLQDITEIENDRLELNSQ